MAALPPGARGRPRPGTPYRSPTQRRNAAGPRRPTAPPDAPDGRRPGHPSEAAPRHPGHRLPEPPSDAAGCPTPGHRSDARTRRARRAPRDVRVLRSTCASSEAVRRPPPEDQRGALGRRPAEGRPGAVGCPPSGRPSGAVACRRTAAGPAGVAVGRTSGVSRGAAGRSGRGTSACAGSTRCPSPARRSRWPGSRRAAVPAVRARNCRTWRTCPRWCRPTARTACPGARPTIPRGHGARPAPTTASAPPPRGGGVAGRVVPTRSPRGGAPGPSRTTAGTARSAPSPARWTRAAPRGLSPAPRAPAPRDRSPRRCPRRGTPRAPVVCPGSGPRPVAGAGVRWPGSGAAGPVAAGGRGGGVERCVRRTSSGRPPGPPAPVRPAPPHRPDSSGHHDSAARRAVPAAGPARWSRPHRWIRPAAATGSAGPAGRRTRAGPPGGTRRPWRGCRPGRCRRCPAAPGRAPARVLRRAPPGCGRARSVVGSGRAALRRSCAPRFLVPGPSSRTGRRAPRCEGVRRGHAYPRARIRIPVRVRRPGRSAVRARHSTGCASANGNQSAGPRHLPGSSPYPAVILSGRLRS
ncbi:hypothetical protein SAMN05216533_6902 [Streptomyces sp. Ag109_O5-10]|nr:hypothetical protein SAMN05216533_6902 [Streptomyces sp. Ag109_O5-10]